MFYDQDAYDIRLEWGYNGIAQLAHNTDVFVIVDVLSFSTCVAIATANGACVYPYPSRDETAAAYAEGLGAVLGSFRRDSTNGTYSLSPSSLVNIPAGTKIVLSSPNGATLSLATGEVPTFAGCLHNAHAVAGAAQAAGKRITVIPAGERWQDGTLRPAIEDLIGAGAVIHHCSGTRSAEAEVAEQTFLSNRENLLDMLTQCSSGRELIEQGFEEDVRLAAQLNQSLWAPYLSNRAYQAATYRPV